MHDASPDQVADLHSSEFDERIIFLDTEQVLEIDLTGMHLTHTAQVNRLYDRIEERIVQTRETLWFFLINYSDCRIDTGAWTAFARRGKALNLAHSMGSVRFDPSDATRKQIERSAGTESFDANLFSTRAEALARLATLPSRRVKRSVHQPNYTQADFAARLTFHKAQDILEIDFHDFTFHHSRDVNDFYNHIEEAITETDQKWFFLINYNNCRIDPSAWVQYARRGKQLNIGASRGTVRFSTDTEVEADIRGRASSQGFNPNICATRDQALVRLQVLKAEAAK